MKADTSGMPCHGSAPICYLVGPLGMVESTRETLSVAGVNDDDIPSEEFYGY